MGLVEPSLDRFSHPMAGEKEKGKPYSAIDALGDEVLDGDEIIVTADDEIVLVENAAKYMVHFMDAEKKTAGEEDVRTQK